MHSSSVYGGMEIYVERVLAHLDRDRYVPTFYFPPDHRHLVPDPMEQHVRDLGVELVVPPSTHLARINDTFGNVWAFARMVHGRRPAIIHVNTAVADRPRVPLLAHAIARRTPLVRTEHLPPLPGSGTRAVRRSVRLLDALTDQLVVVSADNRRAQVEHLGRRADRILVLHNGTELAPVVSHEGRDAAKRSFGLDPAVPLIGAVGRLHEQKGHRHLIDAFRQVLDRVGSATLMIVGDGPLEGELRAQVQALGLADHVVMPGYVPDPQRYIAAFDIAVMPSLFEGFSLSMLEFLAAAKPCVFTDHSSFLEATANGACARIAVAGDSASLADQLTGLLADPVAAEALGLAARRHVEANFSMDVHISRLMELYDTLCAGRRPAIPA